MYSSPPFLHSCRICSYPLRHSCSVNSQTHCLGAECCTFGLRRVLQWVYFLGRCKKSQLLQPAGVLRLTYLCDKLSLSHLTPYLSSDVNYAAPLLCLSLFLPLWAVTSVSVDIPESQHAASIGAECALPLSHWPTSRRCPDMTGHCVCPARPKPLAAGRN